MVNITECTPVQIVWDVKQLLKEWKLENILPHLLAEKIDAEILEMIKIHHIRMLLCNFPLGVQIRFEHNLEQWRYNIGKPLHIHKCCQQGENEFLCKPTYDNKVVHKRIHNENPTTIPAQSPPSQSQQQIRVIQMDMATGNLPTPQESPVTTNGNDLLAVNSTTPPETPKPASSSGSPTRSFHSQILTAAATETRMPSLPSVKPYAPRPRVNLHNILMESKPEGPQFIKIYNVRKTFTKPERRGLVNVIVTYYLRNELRLDLQTSYALEAAILKMFPNERLDMYRKAKRGSLYCKYMNAKKIFYNLKDINAIDSYMRQQNDDALESSDMETIAFTDDTQSMDDNGESVRTLNVVYESGDVNIEGAEEFSYCIQEDNNINLVVPKIEPDSEVSIQTAYRLHREVITLTQPISYQDFLSNACDAYSIPNMDDHYLAVNDCEISEMEFKSVLMQYYKLPSFVVEVKQKSSLLSQLNLNGNDEVLTEEISIQIDKNHLPDANEIRTIPSLLHVVGLSDSCKPLENRHRTAIAKAIIDECLSYEPDRALKRRDFLILAQNICQAFPNEEESTYFSPSLPNNPARGKLWNAYNNKRFFLSNSGVLKRRALKRRKTMDVGDFNRRQDMENSIDEEPDQEHDGDEDATVDFTENTTMDWDYLTVKWSESHEQRWQELRKGQLTPSVYMEIYSILKSSRGCALMEIDVNILYPTVLSVRNWLSLYVKVVDRARGKMRKCDTLPKIMKAIEESNDEVYSASLALLLIPYIFSHNGRKNELNGEKATKSQIQQRFIKEYKSLEDLRNDPKPVDFQIRFVHSHRRIIYTEFSISGCTFQCSDLMESLNSLFHYMLGMNIKYPTTCNHVWQFVQYAIFHIEPKEDKLPFVESIISDLHLS